MIALTAAPLTPLHTFVVCVVSGAHCIDCGRPASIYAVQQAVFDDDIATCSSCGGLVKPDIVFFGEPLPARFHRRRLADMQQADLLMVMGTSLVVQPFASMIGKSFGFADAAMVLMLVSLAVSTVLNKGVFRAGSPADRFKDQLSGAAMCQHDR